MPNNAGNGTNGGNNSHRGAGNINYGYQSFVAPNTTNIHNNNSFFINGPVAIINMTASNSKSSKSKKSSAGTGGTYRTHGGANKMSSNKSGAGDVNNKS